MPYENQGSPNGNFLETISVTALDHTGLRFWTRTLVEVSYEFNSVLPLFLSFAGNSIYQK